MFPFINSVDCTIYSRLQELHDFPHIYPTLDSGVDRHAFSCDKKNLHLKYFESSVSSYTLEKIREHSW